MDLNKKLAVILMLMFVLTASLSGCLDKDEQTGQHLPPSSNSSPVPIINTTKIAYFGEIIEFDASESYDPDGTIEVYSWDFGDNETSEGILATHTYKFENYFNVAFPITYSVLLKIVDNNESWEYGTHEIMVYPREYIFYFDRMGLTEKVPVSSKDMIKASFGNFIFNQMQELTYESSNYINIQPCNWNSTIHIEKPKFTLINSISLTLYNKTGEKITEEKTNLNLFEFWEEKTISIKGKTIKPEEFKSIKLSVNGFSLREKISITYGGESASHICFDFTI